MKTILSPNQSQILESLLPVAEIALDNAKNNNGALKPRTHTLICAPSGTGKSHMMKELGGMLDAPVLLLNVSSWIPLGSRSETNKSLDRILRFVDENPKGIIVLDELDKIDGREDWLGFVRLEIHDILDGVFPEALEIPVESDEEADLW